MSEREINQRTAIEAYDRYDRDPRFRAIAQSVIREAMGEYTMRNPDADWREADRLATNVAAILLERVFKNDAELNAQREIAERYKKLCEETLAVSTRPPPIMIFTGPNGDD